LKRSSSLNNIKSANLVKLGTEQVLQKGKTKFKS
jgi:hypothetical protein